MVRQTVIISLLVVLFCVGTMGCRSAATRLATTEPPTKPVAAESVRIRAEIGFRSKRNLEEHYQKHGREFGLISQADYLRQAQELRDRPAGGDILEAVREDRTTTRFDLHTGDFIAFNEDFTIRTFFRPNDGERYFKRQLKRDH